MEAYFVSSLYFQSSGRPSFCFLFLTSAQEELSTLNLVLEHFILNHHLNKSSTRSPSQNVVPYQIQSSIAIIKYDEIKLN